MKKNMILMAVLAMMMSCTDNKTSKSADNQTSPMEQKTENSSAVFTEVNGVYRGTLPAASSPGIKTTLTLHADKTFSLVSEFLEEKNGVFKEKGNYDIEADILTATSEEGTVSYYKIESNRLRMLDQEKHAITGDLAEAYVLTKDK